MKDDIVLDLETQNSFSDVGGRFNLESLKVSVCGIYSYNEDKFSIFTEDRLRELEPLLQNSARLIGFNIKAFDIPVLQPYLSIDLNEIICIDILEEVRRVLGRRISLDNIAQATLGKGKIADGLEAIRFFREGRFDLLEKYCLDDVRITKDVFEYGKSYGRILYDNARRQVPATWALGPTVEEKIRDAYKNKKRIIIEYNSKNPITPATRRKVEVYYINQDMMATYCHLRHGIRTFRISKVLDTKITDEDYIVPEDFNPQQWMEQLKAV